MTVKKSKKKISRSARKSSSSSSSKLSKKSSGLVAMLKKNVGKTPQYAILKTAYREYKKLSPEQQNLVKGALIKAGIALLV